MVLQPVSTSEQSRQRDPKQTVLDTYEAMQRWPHWNEVYLNCVKESPVSYQAFAEAVRVGDPSEQAFDDVLRRSQMTRDEFDRYLPEFQKFMALCSVYRPGMLSDGVDRIWHGFMLISRRYREFCLEFLGRQLDHLPCSLYPLYGVELSTSSCINKCVPSTCKGDGGGCGPDERCTKESILAGTREFVQAYTFIFGVRPDVTIWNQLAAYFETRH